MIFGADNNLAVGQVFTTSGEDGVVLSLHLDKGERLQSGELLLTAEGEVEITFPAEDGEVEITPQILTDGSGQNLLSSVNWVIAEWSAPLLLTQLTVVASMPPGEMIRVKLFSKGGWRPLVPTDLLEQGMSHGIVPVIASKVMLEPVTVGEYGEVTPVARLISSVSAKAGEQAAGLAIAVGEQRPFFYYGDALSKGISIRVDGLTDAVNKYLDNPEHTLPIPISVKSSNNGKFKVVSFTAAKAKVTEAFDNIAIGSSIPLPWQDETVAQLDLGDYSQLKEVSFRSQSDLFDERLYLEGQGEQSKERRLADSNHLIAQSFSALPSKDQLAGVDILISRPITHQRESLSQIRGTLTLYPDDQGVPAPEFLDGGQMSFILESEQLTSGKGEWLSATVDKSFVLNEGVWWLVLEINEGELLWRMGVPNNLKIGTTLCSVSGAGWQSVEGSLWGDTRIRVVDTLPKRQQVKLRRGENEFIVKPDAEGKVNIDNPITLAQLGDSGGLEVVISAPAAGEVIFDEVRVISVIPSVNN